VVVGEGKGSQFMHLLWNALHLTLQARCHHCAGCTFELKQVGFTAAYRARQCLLTSRNTFISILRAGPLQPHGSESGTWHNRDLIRRHACADALPWMTADKHAGPIMASWSSCGEGEDLVRMQAATDLASTAGSQTGKA
jgi:hypothetical protein